MQVSSRLQCSRSRCRARCSCAPVSMTVPITKNADRRDQSGLKRLAVQQNPRVPEASNERPEVQQTLINTEGGSR